MQPNQLNDNFSAINSKGETISIKNTIYKKLIDGYKNNKMKS